MSKDKDKPKASPELTRALHFVMARDFDLPPLPENQAPAMTTIQERLRAETELTDDPTVIPLLLEAASALEERDARVREAYEEGFREGENAGISSCHYEKSVGIVKAWEDSDAKAALSARDGAK